MNVHNINNIFLIKIACALFINFFMLLLIKVNLIHISVIQMRFDSLVTFRMIARVVGSSLLFFSHAIEKDMKNK